MWRFFLKGLALCFLCTQASAVTISPLVIELNTDHRLTSQLVVMNNSTKKIALETSVHRLSFSSNGMTKIQSSADKNVLVFPPAALLDPGKLQTFRVQWVSNNPLEMSKSYFIRFSNIQINQGNQELGKTKNLQTGINVQINYNALLHVYSSSLQPEVKIHIGKEGNLILTNSGNRFTFTSKLHFKNLNHHFIEALYETIGDQFVPPYSSHTFDTSSQHLPVGTYYGYEQ